MSPLIGLTISITLLLSILAYGLWDEPERRAWSARRAKRKAQIWFDRYDKLEEWDN